MRRKLLLTEFKKLYDGEAKREQGRWYWINAEKKSLISNTWLYMMIQKAKNIKTLITTLKEELVHEVSKQSNESVEEAPRLETTDIQVQEKSIKPTKEELEKLKRKERRLKRKESKQNDIPTE